MANIMSCILSLVWTIGLVQSQTPTMVPTSQPTPDCDTFTISVTTLNDTKNLSSLFAGVFQKTTELQYERPVWQVKSNSNKRLYYLSTAWAIQTELNSGGLDYLIYTDSDEHFPPEGTNDWAHGEHAHAAEVTTDCSSTFAPSISPSNMPSYMPSDDPTSNPTKGPSVSPTFMPSLEPSINPTNIPTVLPTPGCNVIELLSVNYSSVLYINESIGAVSSEEEVVMNIDGWIFWPKDGLRNNRPQWMYMDDDNTDYTAYLYYDDEWTLEVNLTSTGEVVSFVDESESIRKVPLLASDWASESIIAEFEFVCYGSWYPSSVPTFEPSLEPSEVPSLGPSEMPTEPSMNPTYAPTYECNELYVNVLRTNFDIFNESGEYVSISDDDYFLVTSITGTYTLEDNLRNGYSWYENSENSNIWIEWSNGAWFLFNPNEMNIPSLTTLFYISNDKDPPMNDYNNGIPEDTDGFWWLTFEKLNDGTDNVKSYELYITCKLITSPPTSEPTTPLPTCVPTSVPTEQPLYVSTEGKQEDKGDPTYIGLTLIEWFVIIFLLFLCCICIIGVWWYKEYKKAKILESEKNKKFSANNNELDENELFGASHRAYAANNPPNQPLVNSQGSMEMQGRKSKMSYVSEGDDDVGAGTSAPQAGSFENALQLATSHKSQAPI